MDKTKKKRIVILIAIYIVSVVFYCLFVSFFTIPVHIGVDEELYISMAKSFHYQGKFIENGEVLNYSCYLYSIILSMAYYFYSPDNIVFFFRCIGVIIMLSSVFPVYLFTEEMFESRKIVWFITALSLFLPSMADTAFCMQETTAYPLVLWIFYFIYKELKYNVANRITMSGVAIAILCAIGYFIKTYLLFLFGSYIIFMLFRNSSWKGKIKKIVLAIIIFAITMSVGILILNAINFGEKGSNHYSRQILELFPIDLNTVISIGCCNLFYVICTLFYWGVFPCIMCLTNRKYYEKHDRYFLNFIYLSIVLLIFEIVIAIVITEEGKPLLPTKFLYRYFQIFEIPIICMFIKLRDKLQLYGKTVSYGKSIIGFSIVCVCMATWFFTKTDTMRTAIIDAPFFLLLENVSKIVSGMGGIICLSFLTTIFTFYYRFKDSIVQFMSVNIRVLVLMTAGMFVIDMIQLPYYVNVIANGTEIKQEAIIIENYIEKRNIDRVYFIKGDSDRYEESLYAFLDENVETVSVEEALLIQSDNNLFIKASTNDEIMFDKYAINMEMLDISSSVF